MFLTMMLVNFTGQPGAGKSTMAAAVFAKLKTRHWNVEMCTEFTKELVLTGDAWSLEDELLVFAEKYRRIKKLEKVDIVITDSPLINSAIYGGGQFGAHDAAFYESVARKYDSLYFVIERVHDYIAVGRMPNEAAAAEAGSAIVQHVRQLGAPLEMYPGNENSVLPIVSSIEAHARGRGLTPLRT